MIEHEINRLIYKAKYDENVRKALLATKDADDPLKAFCDLAGEMGYDITLGELFAYGMTMNDSKLRATNGGGSFEIEGWNDLYENLIEELS
jgi:hypothetical protein